MNAYRIVTAYGNDHYVIAENIGEAERVFKGKYWPTEIKAVHLESTYVQIQNFDEQAKESDHE